MSIGSNIRKRRRTKDITQEQLADKLAVSRPMIAQIERGVRIPNVSLAMGIAAELGCTLDELCDDDASTAL